MNNKLFDEFDSASSKQWRQQIQFDLEGGDYNKLLVWNSNEDISVKPFYHPEDFKEGLESHHIKSHSWNICQTIYVANVEMSNAKALSAIKSGAESIKFIIPTNDVDITHLIKNINLDTVQIHFQLEFLSEDFIKKTPSKVSIHNDIIEHLARTGNFFYNSKEDFSKCESILKQTKSLNIDGALYQNAGANMVQQLGYLIAAANQYLTHFYTHLNQDFKITFNIAIGSNYFFEIAKIRALRLLWATIANEYKLNPKCKIIATPSKRNKTLYNNKTNMLRTTTEYMSAILGGADTVVCLPYDAIFKKSNEFSNRMSRNQLLILKHESHFNSVYNPVDGTYYIEHLTLQLAEKALTLFKDIEKNGGFLKQLKDGIIQRKIKESALKEQQQFDSGELILLGANKLTDSNNIKDEIDIYPFVKTNQRKTLIEPIIEKRISEPTEKNRLKNEP